MVTRGKLCWRMGFAVRLVALSLTISASAPLYAQNPTARPTELLLAELAAALESGNPDDFLRTRASSLPAEERDWLVAQAPDWPQPSVTILDRGHVDGLIAADVLIAGKERAIAATWQIGVQMDGSGRLGLASVIETSRIDNLLTLEPDNTRLLAVRDLVITGTDFTLTVPSGTAIASRVDEAWTALAIQGRASVSFAPRDVTEQGELRIFGGSPALETTADAVFVRLHPDEVTKFVQGSIDDHPRQNAGTVARLVRLFNERAIDGQTIDLGDLSTRPWAVSLRPGNLLVEFRTRRDGWLTYASVPDAHEDVSLADRATRRQISLYSSASSDSDAGLVVRLDDESYTLLHTDLDIVSDPERQWLRGRVSLQLRMTGLTRTIVLRLADTLHVTSASSPTLGPLMALRASSGSGSILVGLPRALDADDVATFDIQFQGRLPPQSLDDDTPAVELKIDVPDVIGVVPRYLYSNSLAWYPQPETGRHATGTMRVTLPASFNVVATGRRTSTTMSTFGEDPVGTAARPSRTVTFDASQPVRYLAFLAARMDNISQSGASPPASSDVDVFSVPSTAARRRPDADKVNDILTFFARHLGPAPYRSLTLVVLEDRVPSGHSPPYFALVNHALPLTPYSWRNDPLAFDDVPDFFLAHEIAHQWWGQAVAARTYREQWISEGFAQYMAWMYVASVESPETASRLMARMRTSAEVFSAEGPIHLGLRLGHLRNDKRVFRAIAYNKAAVVLHMLRRLIGDHAFMAGLRQILDENRFTQIDSGVIRRTFQAQTPVPLDRFFSRWVQGAALPQLRFTWQQPSDNVLVIDVSQRGEPFDLPFDVTVHYTDGSQQRVPLAIVSDATHFELPAAGRVRRVEFTDPLTPARVLR